MCPWCSPIHKTVRGEVKLQINMCMHVLYKDLYPFTIQSLKWNTLIEQSGICSLKIMLAAGLMGILQSTIG